MPEPNEAGASEATNQTPSAPSKAVESTAPTKEATDKQTTTQPRAEDRAQESDSTTQDMMDVLGIDPAIQAQISDRVKEPAGSHAADATDAPAAAAETEAETTTSEAAEETATEETESDDDDETEATPEAEQKPDKRQKRINRLTRQKAEAEAKLDAAHAENQKLRDQLEQGEKAVESTAPTRRSRLAGIMTEPALDEAIATAEGWVEWCDANEEGVTQGEGDNSKFIGPQDIAKIRRENEKVILLAPNRRQEIQKITAERSQYDAIAQQMWPELFDESSNEHKVQGELEKTYPFLKDIPARNYAVGLIVEGMKSVHARIQAAQAANGGNGERANGSEQKRAISPRAFEPRAPIAPGRPDAPTREVVPSSKKKLNQAMTDLVAGGGRDALVAAMAAMDEAEAPNKSPSERLVKS